jgi:hypothetical protein
MAKFLFVYLQSTCGAPLARPEATPREGAERPGAVNSFT